MATLILSSVGQVFGGPIGSAVGALIGQQIDAEIFKPKGREGPRLSDLSVQTSSYGTPLPKIFGTMRVAGSVVWSTDLQEDRTKEGGGKGRPSTTTYSYRASFAVALSARPIIGVKRIWADGKLLRGAAGDFKSETGFRLYDGEEGQGVDPLIASAEGGEGTPAYRGLALAVFEDFQLADYGNRIPSLTFEVEADVGAVLLDTIIREVSDGASQAETLATLTGYSAHGTSARAAIEALLSALPHHISDDGEALLVRQAAPEAVTLDAGALGSGFGEQGSADAMLERQGADAAPDEIAIRYYEPARDYQVGLQRARLSGPGRRAERIDLPAALSAPRAKAIAETRLERGWAERISAKITLPWRDAGLRPGEAVRIPGRAGEWRVAGLTLEKMVTELALIRIGGGAIEQAGDASPGRIVGDPDLVHGPTIAYLLDLPTLDDTLFVAPRLIIAAAGPSAGWRHAALDISLNGGVSYESIGQTAPQAVIGEAVTVLPEGQSAQLDDIGRVEIALLHDGMWLEGRSDNSLVMGDNLALLGDELIQFGRVETLGDNHVRISRLLRGRRGTEWAMDGHSAGERFILLDPSTLKAFDAPLSALNADAMLYVTGIGDEVSSQDGASVVGHSIRPPAPVHLSAFREANDDIHFSWARRSRLGWSWVDGADIPLGEEQERYDVTITLDTGASRSVDAHGPAYIYSAAHQTADGADSASLFTIKVVQRGTLAESLPAATASFIL